MKSNVYLGDGLYVNFDGYQIELYASDGIQKTNQVFLDPNVLRAFNAYTSVLEEAMKKNVLELVESKV